MKKTKVKERNPHDSALRQPLLDLRHSLLDLHKKLIESERAVYEANIGRIASVAAHSLKAFVAKWTTTALDNEGGESWLNIFTDRYTMNGWDVQGR